MSTNGTIAIVHPRDGTVRSIYLHWDANLALDILKRCYTDYDKALALVELGDLSVLGDHCTQPHGHTFDDPWNGFCIAYHRDRGEGLEIAEYGTVEEWYWHNGSKYAHLFENGVWK